MSCNVSILTERRVVEIMCLQWTSFVLPKTEWMQCYGVQTLKKNNHGQPWAPTCAARLDVRGQRRPGGWGRSRRPQPAATLPASARNLGGGRRRRSPWRWHHSARRPEVPEGKTNKKNQKNWNVFKAWFYIFFIWGHKTKADLRVCADGQWTCGCAGAVDHFSLPGGDVKNAP